MEPRKVASSPTVPEARLTNRMPLPSMSCFEVKGVRGLAEDVPQEGVHEKLFDAVQDRLGNLGLLALGLLFVLIAPVVERYGISDVF